MPPQMTMLPSPLPFPMPNLGISQNGAGIGTDTPAPGLMDWLAGPDAGMGMGMGANGGPGMTVIPPHQPTAMERWCRRRFNATPDALTPDQLGELAGWVLKEAERLRKRWQGRDGRMQKDHGLFSLANKLGTLGHEDKTDDEKEAAGIRQTILPQPYVVPMKIANMETAAGYRFNLPAHDLLSTAVVQQVENFTAHWWNQALARLGRQLGGNPLRTMALHGLVRGWMTCLLLPDSEQENPSFPYRWRVEDPITVHPDTDGDGNFISCVHQYTTSVRKALNDYPEAAATFGDDEEDEDATVTCCGYYDTVWHMIVLSDGSAGSRGASSGRSITVKPPKPHGVTDLDGNALFPWLIILPLGDLSMPTDGRADTVDSTMVGPSILYAVHEWYRQLCMLTSMLLTQVAKSTNPPTVTYIRDGKPVPEPLSLDIGARNFLWYQESEGKILDLAPNPGNLQPLLAILQDAQDKSTLPGVSFGNAGSIQSGYGVGLLSGPANDIITPFKDSLKLMIQSVLERMLQITATATAASYPTLPMTSRQGLLVSRPGGTRFDPNLIRQVFEGTGVEVDVQFGELTPQDKAALFAVIGPMVAARLLDRYTARQEMGIQDPLLIAQRLAIQDAVENPSAAPILGRLSVFASDPAALQELFQLAQRLQQQTMQQGGGAPGGGGGLAPSAAPLPTGVTPLEAQAGPAGLAGQPPGRENPAEITARNMNAGYAGISGGSPPAPMAGM